MSSARRARPPSGKVPDVPGEVELDHAGLVRAVGLFNGVVGRAVVLGEERPSGVLVRFAEDQPPSVMRLESSEVHLGSGELGLVIWTEPRGDLCSVFEGRWQKPRVHAQRPARGADVRGPNGEGGLLPQSIGQLTAQLDPLFLPGVVKSLAGQRAGPFITPPDGGALLMSRPTFRRAQQAGSELPPASLVLAGRDQSASLEFSEQQAEVRFEALSSLPSDWHAGLPPGQYTLTWRDSVDAARLRIHRGLWDDALARLDKVDPQADLRYRGLADLYRGVIHAEWGMSQEEAADSYFRKALVSVEQSSLEDRFRALNNDATFLLNRTQDRVLDHAFQMASGARAVGLGAVELGRVPSLL